MKEKIEAEIRLLCKDQYLICRHYLQTEKANNSLECRVFYYKIMADTFRYLLSIEQSKQKQDLLAVECDKRYKEAIKQADELEATNPLRLAAGLNYSIFLAEAKGDLEGAIWISKKTFDDCLDVYSGLDKNQHFPTTRVMVLLRNNIEIWSIDQNHQQKLNDLDKNN